jgi:hypothetical protein
LTRIYVHSRALPSQHVANKLLRPCVHELRALEAIEAKWKLLAQQVHAERLDAFVEATDEVADHISGGSDAATAAATMISSRQNEANKNQPTPSVDDLEVC